MHPVKIQARQLHRTLRGTLADPLRGCGMRLLPGPSFAASRPHGDRHLTLWAQCDRHGWDEGWGSSFTIELQLSEFAAPASGALPQRARLAQALAPGELERLRALNNEVIAALPGYRAGRMLYVPDPEGGDVLVVGHVPEDAPYRPGRDVWLHYGTEADLDRWAAFLAAQLPGCIERWAAAQSP